MARIIITGATGYLGGRLASALLSQGHQIMCPILNDTSYLYLAPLSQTELVDTDVCDFDCRLQKFQPDIVIHTAGRYERGQISVPEIINANLIFPLRILNALMVSKCKERLVWLNANTALDRELNSYALSKHHFGDWGKYYTETSSLNFCDVFLEQFIGPGDNGEKFIPFLLKRMRENIPIDLTDGLQQRDFVYIDDVVNSFVLLAAKSPPGYSRIPLGTGQAPRIRDVVEMLKYLTGSSSELRFGAIPYRSNEPQISMAKTETLENLGYRCEITWQEGLRRIVEFENDSRAKRANKSAQTK